MEMLVRDLLTYTQLTTVDNACADVVDANEVMKATVADLSGAITDSSAQITADPLPLLRK